MEYDRGEMKPAPTLTYALPQRHRRLRVVVPILLLLTTGAAAAGWRYRAPLRAYVGRLQADLRFHHAFDRSLEDLTADGTVWLAPAGDSDASTLSTATRQLGTLLASSAAPPSAGATNVKRTVLFARQGVTQGGRWLAFGCVSERGFELFVFQRGTRTVAYAQPLFVPPLGAKGAHCDVTEVTASGATVRAVLTIDGVPNAVSWSVQPPGPASPPPPAAAGLSIVASGITPDDGWVASGTWWPNMRGWRLVAGPSVTQSVPSETDARAISFLPDGRLAVVTPKHIRLARAESPDVEQHALPESHRPQEVFVFSRDGTRLFAGGDVQPAWMVETPTGKTRTLSKHSVGWAKAAFADDRTLLFVDDATRARVDWESKRAVPLKVEGFGSFYRLGAGGGRAAGLVASGVGVFDVNDGHEVRRIPMRPGFDSLSLSPDGRWLAVRGAGLALFDVATGSPLLEHGPDADFDRPLSQVRWSADGLRGAAIGGEAVYVWSLREPRWLARFPHGLSGDYKSVAISADGRRLAASGSASAAIAYWPDIDAQLPPPAQRQ
jgi:hypothetical protein